MIIDFCTYVGSWPTYHLPQRTPRELVERMDRCGIGSACVSLAGAMLRFNTDGANSELAASLRPFRSRLWPIGSLDLTMPTWRSDIRVGLERYRLHGFRLHPTYHGYALDSDTAIECAQFLAELRTPLFIALYVDEERFQHAALRVSEVPLAELANLVRRAPKATYVLNGLKVEHAVSLHETGVMTSEIFMDIGAMDMPFDGLHTYTERFGAGRLVFGSQMPFLYPEAALMVLAHAGLTCADRAAIAELNVKSSPVLSRIGLYANGAKETGAHA
jgi:predicted TIM-barrel fold metal-dependent hydrolase